MRSLVCILVAVFAVSCAEIIGVRIDTSAAEIPVCNDIACNKTCIAVRWEGGFCQDGYCWCWKYKTSSERDEKRVTEILSATTGIGDCQDDQCNQNCIAVHWDGGYCKDGQCWCWKHRAPSDRIEKRLTEIQAAATGLGNCQDDQCNQNCIAVHWDGGFCKDGQCWCWKHRTPAERVEKPLIEIQPTTTASSQCEKEKCSLGCKVLRYNGGSCQSGDCMCWKDRPERGTWLPMNDLATNYRDRSGNEVVACTDPVHCLDACQHHGAAGGFCLKSVCWCSMSLDRKTPSNRRVRPVIELQGNITGNAVDSEDATCDRTLCNRQCRANGKRAGVCLYGYCWCSDSRKQEQERTWKKLSDIPQ